jgi:cellulose biosynthesis protein BcsQ
LIANALALGCAGKERLVRAISISNFKGGVGNLADYLSRQGKVVVLIDCDRQRNASGILPTMRTPMLREVLMRQASLLDTIQKARPTFYVVPAHPNVEEAAKHITTSGPRTLKLLDGKVVHV